MLTASLLLLREASPPKMKSHHQLALTSFRFGEGLLIYYGYRWCHQDPLAHSAFFTFFEQELLESVV